jgi:hypothetical protein
MGIASLALLSMAVGNVVGYGVGNFDVYWTGGSTRDNLDVLDADNWSGQSGWNDGSVSSVSFCKPDGKPWGSTLELTDDFHLFGGAGSQQIICEGLVVIIPADASVVFGDVNDFRHENYGNIEADPHFTGAEGEKFDFKGEDKKVYNILSTSNMTVNGRITHDSFYTTSESVAGPVFVHGSYFTEAFVNMAIGANRTMQIAYKAGKEQESTLVVIDGHPHTIGVDSMLSVGTDNSFSVSSVKAYDGSKSHTASVKYVATEVHGQKELVVSNNEWAASIKSVYYPLREQNDDKQRLDIALMPKSLKLGKVAPHGLIGQTFDMDNIAVDGARDNYDDKVVTTKAMGEGAIEGVAKDYEIDSHNPYSPTFKYSRWNLLAAAPRDISKLEGQKRAVKPEDVAKISKMRVEL